MLGFAMLVLLASPHVTIWLHGTIRAGDSGEPVAGALVQVLDEHQSTWSDSAGDYRLEVSGGAHLLKVSRPGFDARTIEVLVGTDSNAIRVDISLTPRPVIVSEIRVVGEKGTRPTAVPTDGLWVGSRTLAGDTQHSDPAFPDADVLQSLTVIPGVVGAPELPATLHIRGGSADQNLILVDGVPLFNPYHSAGGLSALDPDVVSSVTVYTGVAPPRFGDALSGVVAIQTQDSARGGLGLRGAVGPLALRETVTGPLPGVPGTFILSARHSARALFTGPSSRTDGAASFADVFAKGVLDLAHGELEILSFASGDHLAFDARVLAESAGVAGAAFDSAATQASQTMYGQGPRNEFTWSSGTQAVVWRGARGAAARLEARAWRARFAAAADWATDSGPVRLASRLTSTGIGADLTWRLLAGFATAGVTVEHLQTAYAVRRVKAPAPGDTTAGLVGLGSSAVALSADMEDRWRVGARWELAVGVRDRLTSAVSHELEPRVSVRFTPAPRFTLSAGYARTRQPVQSLRNEESILDAVVGVGLPMGAGASGVPSARGDLLAVAAQVRLGAATTLTLDGYTRRLSDLVLVAPVTAQPFVTGRFARGSGRASGVTLSLEHRGARLFARAGYAFAAAVRQTADLSYHPSFATAHSLAVAVGYRLTSATTLRAALWASTGRPTSVVAGDIEWAPYGLVQGTSDMAGSPQHILGALNAERLPAYARLDLGIRREWRPRVLGRSAGLSGTLTVSNVLNRTNALGTVWPGGGRTAQSIPMQPRSVTLGFEWSY